jgi:hypothetical protein
MTSPTTNTMYDDIAPFFGKAAAEQAKLFVALNYRGSNYATSLNAGDAKSIKREQLWQLMLAKNYRSTQTADDNTVSNVFVDFVKAVGAHHKNLVNKDGSTEATAFKNAVCGTRFALLHPDAQIFLTEHVNLVDVTNNTQAVTLDNPLATSADYRVNLKQVDWKTPRPTSVSKTTLFCSTLPELPSGTKDQNGTPLNLCTVYTGALAGGYLSGGAGEDLPVKAWVDAGLDLSKFLKGVTEAQKRGHEVSSVDTPIKIYDVASNVVYAHNKDNELVRVGKDGKETKVVDWESGEDCYSTQLKNCDQVYQCLLSGDKRALHKCLRKFANERNLFAVAKEELGKVHPDVIQKLLDTFHVQYSKSSGSVEHYAVWLGHLKQRLVSNLGEDDGEEVHKAILNNNHLLDYIRGLIDIAKSNSKVFSKTQVFSDMENRELKKSSKIKYFYRPTTADSANMMPTMLDSLLNQLRVLPQNLAGQYSAMINTTGAVPGMTSFFGFPGMRGGAKKLLSGAGKQISDNVKSMRTVYKNILEELNRRGKDLVDQDKEQIDQAFMQLEENNNRLEKTIRDLQAFVRLNNAVDVGISKLTRREYDGLSDDKSVASLKSTVSNLESCLGRVTRDQVGLMTSLVDQVLRPMALLTIGAPTAHLRQM